MRRLWFAIPLLAVAIGAWRWAFTLTFEADTTPQGAYQRIAKNVSEGKIDDVFAYLETEAQWASFTIRDARLKACRAIQSHYPAEEGAPLLEHYKEECAAPDGPQVFALVAKRRGWVPRLKRDLSGVARTEVEGPRATVVTARGTRYSFRRRDNGIWGLTLFTAELLAESERASRDLITVEKAAQDYERTRAAREP